MVRVWSVIFGVGLGILWLVGLGNPNAAAWLTWLDGFAAICAFTLGGLSGNRPLEARGTRVAGPYLMALGLLALWLIGITTTGAAWQNWWTFAFACGFLLLGLAAAGQARMVTPVTHDRTTPIVTDKTEEERERFRRGA